MEDCLICPFCHAIVLPIEFDGGWKCECVRCEYTSREGDTKDEAIEMHMELQSKEADASVLRSLVKELADGLSRVMKVSKWCDCGCDDCEEQNNCNAQKMRELVAKALQMIGGTE